MLSTSIVNKVWIVEQPALRLLHYVNRNKNLPSCAVIVKRSGLRTPSPLLQVTKPIVRLLHVLKASSLGLPANRSQRGVVSDFQKLLFLGAIDAVGLRQKQLPLLKLVVKHTQQVFTVRSENIGFICQVVNFINLTIIKIGTNSSSIVNKIAGHCLC